MVLTDPLTIELGTWSDINDYLPASEPAFIGTHMLNYGTSVHLRMQESITLVIEDEAPLSLVVNTDDTSGTKTLTTPDFDVNDGTPIC